jgi:hypothetical protein
VKELNGEKCRRDRVSKWCTAFGLVGAVALDRQHSSLVCIQETGKVKREAWKEYQKERSRYQTGRAKKQGVSVGWKGATERSQNRNKRNGHGRNKRRKGKSILVNPWRYSPMLKGIQELHQGQGGTAIC